ncbi:hypothetical protein EH2_03447 [Bacillus subtilis]|nr:hypothetical protein EH2_03447 [Bacillus subtilis]
MQFKTIHYGHVTILNSPFLFTLVFFFSCMNLFMKKVVYVDDQLPRGE